MRRCPLPGSAGKAPTAVRRPSLSSAGYPSGIGGNHDVEARVRLAQRLFDLLRRLGLGEYEAEVAVALRQRDERAADRDRDLEPGDVRGGSRLLLTLDPLEYALVPDRQHHHARGQLLAAHVVEWQVERVAEDQLLERHAEPEAEAARAEPADRARGELEHLRRRPEAELGVDRAFGQPERFRRVRREPADLRLHLRRLARRRHVDRLLEVGAVEWVGLVEHGEHLEPSAVQEALDRDLIALGEALYEQWRVRVVEDGADAGRGGGCLIGIVRPDHALATRAGERLQDAREADGLRVVAERPLRLGDAGAVERLAHLR